MMPFWSDDFDMDLPKVIPAAMETIAPVADVKLWTHGGTTDGRLNHPSVWPGLTSMLAFFSLRPSEMLRAPYVSTKPVVECTFAEAIRDCWCHHYAFTVDGLMVWDTTHTWRNQFEPLMYDLRGWRALEPRRRGRIKASVVRDLRIAVDRLSKMTGRG